MSSPAELSSQIKQQSRLAGFDLVGIAPAVTPSGLHDFFAWLDKGHAGTMDYLPRRREAYAHPSAVLPSAQSLVMLGVNYHVSFPSEVTEAADAPVGRVARYAWSEVDYHDLLRARLKQLAAAVNRIAPGARTRGVVDTAPLLERDFARLAGLGWFGKNTMLINKRAGSYFFLAALLTDLDLAADEPHTASHCGTCTRCLDACPTDAFAGPYQLDARKCISYLTIEHKGPIAPELRPGMGGWLFGCDICQDVCPWNRKAPVSRDAAFQARPDLPRPDLIAVLELDENEFETAYGATALSRPGHAGLLRNAALALGNQRNAQAVPSLSRRLNHADPAVRGACAWALGEIGGAPACAALRDRQATEPDLSVQSEIQTALAAAQRNLQKVSVH